MGRHKQLIDIAQIIKESIDLGYFAGLESSRVILSSAEEVNENIEARNNYIRELKTKAITKMVSRWIPKTDFMQGDTE